MATGGGGRVLWMDGCTDGAGHGVVGPQLGSGAGCDGGDGGDARMGVGAVHGGLVYGDQGAAVHFGSSFRGFISVPSTVDTRIRGGMAKPRRWRARGMGTDWAVGDGRVSSIWVGAREEVGRWVGGLRVRRGEQGVWEGGRRGGSMETAAAEGGC